MLLLISLFVTVRGRNTFIVMPRYFGNHTHRPLTPHYYIIIWITKTENCNFDKKLFVYLHHDDNDGRQTIVQVWITVCRDDLQRRTRE